MLDDEIRSLGRSLQHTLFSALIDRSVSPDEMRGEMLSLIRGWPARSASRGRRTSTDPRASANMRVPAEGEGAKLATSLGQVRFRVLVSTHRSRFGRGVDEVQTARREGLGGGPVPERRRTRRIGRRDYVLTGQIFAGS
ncbi:MAG TPA: hypothetical protein VI094_11070 [Propionibacteriaceae bacterium]